VSDVKVTPLRPVVHCETPQASSLKHLINEPVCRFRNLSLPWFGICLASRRNYGTRCSFHFIEIQQREW